MENAFGAMNRQLSGGGCATVLLLGSTLFSHHQALFLQQAPSLSTILGKLGG